MLLHVQTARAFAMIPIHNARVSFPKLPQAARLRCVCLYYAASSICRQGAQISLSTSHGSASSSVQLCHRSSVVVVVVAASLVVPVATALALLAAHNPQRLAQVLVEVQAVWRGLHQSLAVDRVVAKAAELLRSCRSYCQPKRTMCTSTGCGRKEHSGSCLNQPQTQKQQRG